VRSPGMWLIAGIDAARQAPFIERPPHKETEH
jgi:hypothetical protein